MTIAVNFIPPDIKIDYIFLNNTRRYSLMAPYINEKGLKVIATSNITSVGKPFDYVVDYEKIMTDRNELYNNALSLFLNLLENIDERSLTLARFDGFTPDMTSNYVNESYERTDAFEYFERVNKLLKEKIRYYSRTVPVKFITKSKYW